MKISKEVQAQARRLMRLCIGADGLMDEAIVRQVADKIAAEKPRNYLALLTAFTELVRLECAAHTATITSAVPLTEAEQAAIAAALKAQKEWAETPWMDRASVMLKIATLISGKYRYLINAATMLGQGKTTMQAEIDSACELVDFLRYNAFYASQIYSDQPCSDKGTLNYVTYRAMEGFVFAITPFNFTSIASNLCLSPVLMGNVCIWKPSTTALLSNYLLMKILEELLFLKKEICL